MSYTQQTWANNDPTSPFSAARFTVIENGIANAASGVSKGTMRTGAITETASRLHVNYANVAVLATGTLFLTAIDLPKGAVISNITYMSATTAVGVATNQWFGLYDSSRNQLAVTTDDTSTAWNANSEKTLAIATIAAGASATFTTTYSGLHYLGIMVKATTVPTLFALAFGVTNLLALAPIVTGTSDTTQSTRPAFAHQATGITATANLPYAYVS